MEHVAMERPFQGRGFIEEWAVVSALTLIMAVLVASTANGQVKERLDFLRNQTGCRSDIAQFCRNVKAGGGRLYNCLVKNKARLTDSCIKVLPEGEKLLRQAGILGGSGTAPKAFKTSEDAVAAFVDALRKRDTETVFRILGQDSREWIISGDEVEDKLARERFLDAFDEKHALVTEDVDGRLRATLVVGAGLYPFPVPLVKGETGWAFDPEQGREEILVRRIGANELATMLILLAIADAQYEYAGIDWDGNGLLEYAAKFRSSDGQRDGLYWPTAGNEPLSPLGPLVVEATAEGYQPKVTSAEGEETNAFHGYRFKLLTRQGPDAPGGAHDYMVDGNMVGGFAILAYPAKYGASGIMTFVISHDGALYETHLGPETEETVKAITEFNPGEDWKKVSAELQ